MSLSRSCRLFGMSRQTIYQKEHYYRLKHIELKEVKNLILRIRMDMPRIGTRKLYYLIKPDLVKKNIKIGRDGIFDLLRSEHLLVKRKKNYTKTTDSKHWLKKHPNLYLNLEINEPEQAFVSDITYVKSKERTHYLSLVTDAYSRKIMGYHLSDDMRAENVVKALRMAIKNRRTTKPSIHHSDRGMQYCSEIYLKELRKNGIQPSMTDGYDCYQNALAERVNGILKNEFFIAKCKNMAELNQLVKESIRVYNQKRPHLNLEMKTPNFVHKKTVKKYLHGLN